MLLNTVLKAYKTDLIADPKLSEGRYATIVLFRKMQQHCNFVADLDLEAMNDPVELRDVVKNISYILAITALKTETM